ncbi:hypothetical protein EPO44_13620, partial [bacterium]
MSDTPTTVVAIRSRLSLPQLHWGLVLMFLLIGSLGFYIVYPLILILINSFNVATIADPPVYGLQAWRDAFNEPGIWQSLWNSIKIGVILQVIALPLGIFISWLLARTNIFFAAGFELFFWVSFMMPTIATTFGWMLLLDPNTGLVNT